MLFNKIPYEKISMYNVTKLLLFVKDEYRFRNKMIDIKWGPGNNGNRMDNVKKHFIKHVLSDEGYYWVNILNDISCKEYEQYAINIFYKMKNVIVHSDGVNVYLSGIYGNVFIVGRYDDNGLFGVSSCYYVKDGDKLGRYNDYCFEIEF
jgi:hypothetical protein